MKKVLYLICAYVLLFISCSPDNDEEIIPDFPEIDTDISVPNDNTSIVWEPGMPYAPYPGMPEESAGVEINIIVIDAETHGEKIYSVLLNEGWPWKFTQEHKENVKQICFPKHSDIKLHITESYDIYNPNKVPCDIVNTSFSSFGLNSAKANLDKFENTEDFPNFPLIITSAGNGSNMFTQDAWDLCLQLGGLSWVDHLLPHFGWDPEGPFTPEQSAWYKPGDVTAAYAIQDLDNRNHAKDYIVVGHGSGGNKPGPILKDRWICTYYSYNILDSKIDGTSYSTPFVVKIAAEIKRRAPHYTNDEIAQLMFSTADDIGEEGCDEIYGHGVLNIVKIWEELSKRGY